MDGRDHGSSGQLVTIGGTDAMGASSGGRTHPGEVLLAVVAAVSWAFLAMAGLAALGLHLVGADGAGALGPMTAAAVVLAVGGSVSPVRGCGAFGLQGAQARSAIDIAPPGIGLVGALLLGGVFARSLREPGALIGGAEPAARAGAVVLLFLLVLAGLTWVGNDTVTIDAATLDLKGKPEQEGLFGELPGEPGDIADIGSGLLPDRIERLIDDQGGGRVHRRGGALCAGRQWSGASRCCSSRCSSRCRWRAARRCRAALRRHTVPSGRPPPRCAAYWCSRSGPGLAAALYAASGDDHPCLVLGPRCSARRTGCGSGCRWGCSRPGTAGRAGRWCGWGPIRSKAAGR